MRFLLINPSWERLVGSDRRFNRPWPPLSLLNCTAILERAGYEVSVIDARSKNISKEVLQKRASQADFILITSSPLDRWQCPNLDLEPFFSFTSGIPKEKLIICGVHGTIYPERILYLTKANFIIKGEPEAPILDFIEKKKWEDTLGVSYLKNGKAEHNPQCPPINLNDLPLPAYNLIDPNNYYYEVLGERMALLEASRGCPYQRPFCLKIMYGKGVRIKPIYQVIDEIKLVIKKYRFRCIYFIDIEFAFDKQRIIELCQSLLKTNLSFTWACQTRLDNIDEELLSIMYHAGCRLLHFGIETGKYSTQKKIKKEIEIERAKHIIDKAHKIGIAAVCFYIFGFPKETRKDREKTLNLALSLNSAYASFHLLAPYPATAIFKRYLEDGEFFPKYLPDIRVSEINRWIKYALCRFYLRPKHIAKTLRHFIIQGNIIKKIRLFKEFLC